VSIKSRQRLYLNYWSRTDKSSVSVLLLFGCSDDRCYDSKRWIICVDVVLCMVSVISGSFLPCLFGSQSVQPSLASPPCLPACPCRWRSRVVPQLLRPASHRHKLTERFNDFTTHWKKIGCVRQIRELMNPFKLNNDDEGYKRRCTRDDNQQPVIQGLVMGNGHVYPKQCEANCCTYHQHCKANFDMKISGLMTGHPAASARAGRAGHRWCLFTRTAVLI